MKKIFILFAFLLACGSSTFGQNIWTVNYNMGIPLGDLSDYITKSSFRGFSVNGNAFVTDNISVGGTFQWNTFYEKYPRDTYQLDDGAVTGTVWARIYSLPFLVNARYNFSPGGTVRPYVGLGTGTWHIQQRTQVGLYADEPKNWRFGLAPEAGVYVPLGLTDVGFHAKVAYHHVFYNVRDISALQYIDIAVGLSFFPW